MVSPVVRAANRESRLLNFVSCSTQLSMNFIMLLNFKMPTIIGGERGVLVVEPRTPGARGRGLDTYLRRVVSLSNPKSTGNTQEAVALSRHD